MKNKRNGKILICIGLILVAASLGLLAYNIYDDSRAASASEEIIAQLKSHIEQHRGSESSSDEVGIQAEIPSVSSDNDYDVHIREDVSVDMPVADIDGYQYIGIITIPPLEIELPIMNYWDYDSMKLSPCRYSGSVYRNDLVICAHNYRSHFGRLDKLQRDDMIIITDTFGNVFRYKVVEIETLSGTAVEEMSSGDWDLTLFTCNYSGIARITVRCQYID